MAHIFEITDIHAPELRPYVQLTHAQLRSRRDPEQGILIAESAKVIACALNAGCRPVSFLMERRQLPAFAEQFQDRCGDVPVYTADREVLAQLTGYALTRGMLCAMRRPALPAMEDLCRNARRIAVLEHVTDSSNVGAIFRCAAALGMDAVLAAPSCCDPFYRRSIRVSMGNVFLVPWTFIGGRKPAENAWPEEGMKTLRKLGFQTAAMALADRSISIDDPRLKEADRLAIVLGTEGDGLAGETLADCDYVVKIPMSHGVDSLNVAAASAVAFWEIGRK